MSDDVLKVTLLGTGIPNPSIHAFGTSTLIEAGGQRVMIDCGRGTVIRLSQMGLPVGYVDTVILSHYHSDHYSGIFDLLMSGAIPQGWAGRGGPLIVYGLQGWRIWPKAHGRRPDPTATSGSTTTKSTRSTCASSPMSMKRAWSLIGAG